MPRNPKHLPLPPLINRLSIRILQINPLPTRHIQRQHPILPLFLPGPPSHVQIHRPLRRRPLHIEMHMQMLRPRPIFLQPGRNSPVPCPTAPGGLAVSFDLPLGMYALAGEELETGVVFTHAVGGAVEDGGFAVGAEDFEPEDCEYAASC